MRAKRRLIPDKQSIAAQPQRARGSALASHLPIAQTPPSHPGQILLADVLEPLGLTQTEAARRLGRTEIKAEVRPGTHYDATKYPDFGPRVKRSERFPAEA